MFVVRPGAQERNAPGFDHIGDVQSQQIAVERKRLVQIPDVEAYVPEAIELFDVCLRSHLPTVPSS